MSLAEIKEQATHLSSGDRLVLAAFLAELEEINEREFQSEVDRRMKAMDSGKKVSQEEIEAAHLKLKESSGR